MIPPSEDVMERPDPPGQHEGGEHGNPWDAILRQRACEAPACVQARPVVAFAGERLESGVEDPLARRDLWTSRSPGCRRYESATAPILTTRSCSTRSRRGTEGCPTTGTSAGPGAARPRTAARGQPGPRGRR